MKEQKAPEHEQPPILGSWSNIYLAVLIFLAVEIVLFYFFSQYFA